MGKPLGVSLGSLLAIKSRIGVLPDDVTLREFIGGACLCGIGGTIAVLMADQAFPQEIDSAVAKIGVLIGSALAALIGAGVLVFNDRVAASAAEQ